MLKGERGCPRKSDPKLGLGSPDVYPTALHTDRWWARSVIGRGFLLARLQSSQNQFAASWLSTTAAQPATYLRSYMHHLIDAALTASRTRQQLAVPAPHTLRPV